MTSRKFRGVAKSVQSEVESVASLRADLERVQLASLQQVRDLTVLFRTELEEMRSMLARIELDTRASAQRIAISCGPDEVLVRSAGISCLAGSGASLAKSGVILIGAGGHAKVVIELLREAGERIDFCVGGPESVDTCMGVAVLKGDEYLRKLRTEGYAKSFVAIGSNGTRQQLARVARDLGYQLLSAVSPKAMVSPSAQIGQGTAIMAGTVVNADTVVEDLVIVNTGATIDHDCRIGEAAHIGPRCALAGNVHVGERSLLGVGCAVIPEVTIGSDVTIGAGAVVIADIPAGATAVGIPAKIVNS
jgi:UDP-perosamine 4-acetyltransferase